MTWLGDITGGWMWVLAAADADPAHEMLMTFGVAIAAGALLITAARLAGLPAIVLLLIGGFLLGPGRLEWVDPKTLGDGLRAIVAMCIGLILFEGGLTLNIKGYREAPTMIRRLLTFGVMITWFGAALLIWLLARCSTGGRIPGEYAFLAASLVIVTGPTVIGPLLKRIRVSSRLHNVLHWEGVLIDPIGVFIALLCFEYVVVDETGLEAVMNLALRVGSGLGIGVVGGLLLIFLTRRKLLPESMLNVGAVGFAVAFFILAEYVIAEAGLLAVTAAGFVFAAGGSFEAKQVKEFKSEVIDLLIGTLFVLLSARLSVAQFVEFGWTGVVTVVAVMLIVRPLSIFLCSIGLDLSLNEKVFLAWVGPRGIVAASMASLFALSIAQSAGAPDSVNFNADRAAYGTFVETFVYSMIIATIFIQGGTAGVLAKLLHVRRSPPVGWMIVGANQFARRVASFLQRALEVPVVIVDTNGRAVQEARREDLTAFVGDARDNALQERTEFHPIGRVLALTDNEDLNVRVCQAWRGVVGSTNTYRCNPVAADGEETQDAQNGVLVWKRLPRPSLISGELSRREAAVFEAAPRDPAASGDAAAIAAVLDGRLVLDPSEEALAGAKDDDRVLFLRRRADYLARSLHPSLILSLTTAADLEAVLSALMDEVVKIEPRTPREATIHDLMERESTFPAAIGNGVAIPHAYVEGLDRRLCGLARLRSPLETPSPDGEPIRLVFLLLSPPGDPEGHLATLAELARCMIDDETRAMVYESSAPADVLAAIRVASIRASRER